MKKLLSIYLVTVAVIVLFVYFISLNKGVDFHTGSLPETIAVYFPETGETKDVNFEEYLVCVVSAEVPASFEEEAIKAQAVAARTYIYNKYKKFTENPSLAPDEHKTAIVCTDSKHCCAYYSKEKLAEIHGDEWMKKYYGKLFDAVSETRGEIVAYGAEPIVAVFHSSAGGCRTENSSEVWGGSFPYLVSVESPDEDKREGYNSTVRVTCDEFCQKINEQFPEALLGDDRSVWLGDISYTAGNSVNYINIGSTAVKGTQMRSIFGLKSACFEISMLDDSITFSVHGSGHGVGMSQHGANIMAQKGSTYKEILTHYYTGTEIIKP